MLLVSSKNIANGSCSYITVLMPTLIREAIILLLVGYESVTSTEVPIKVINQSVHVIGL